MSVGMYKEGLQPFVDEPCKLLASIWIAWACSVLHFQEIKVKLLIVYKLVRAKRSTVFTKQCVYTNSMQQSPSWEADTHSASQEILRFYGTLSFITVFKTTRHW
jgi:hypothetical protein